MQARTDSRDGARCPGDSACRSPSMGSSMYRLAKRLRRRSPHPRPEPRRVRPHPARLARVLRRDPRPRSGVLREHHPEQRSSRGRVPGITGRTLRREPGLQPGHEPLVCRIQNETKGSMVAVAPTEIDMSCSVPGCPAAAGSQVTVEVRGKFRSSLRCCHSSSAARTSTSARRHRPDRVRASPGPCDAATRTHRRVHGEPLEWPGRDDRLLRLGRVDRRSDRLPVGFRRERRCRHDRREPDASRTTSRARSS